MDPTVIDIDKEKIKKRLKKEDKEAYDLIIALEDVIQKRGSLIIEALEKIRILLETKNYVQD